MSGRVQLDLNFPAFQAQLFDLDVNEIRQVFKTFKKLKGMTWAEVYRDPGLNWEEIRTRKGNYTIRVSRQCRAVVGRIGDAMCFKALHGDHDGAYGKQ